MKLKSHPYADLFPMMTATEREALAADIAANGLRQPIVLYQKQVLDGRNRLQACETAGVEPTFSEHEGDDASALALVISLNVQRRTLTSSQWAIVAARALPEFEEAAKKRQDEARRGQGKSSPNRRSREDAAKEFKVSDKSVQQAKALLTDATDLAEQVLACTLSLAAAYETLQQRRKEAAQKAKDAERAAQYKEAVSNGLLAAGDDEKERC